MVNPGGNSDDRPTDAASADAPRTPASAPQTTPPAETTNPRAAAAAKKTTARTAAAAKKSPPRSVAAAKKTAPGAAATEAAAAAAAPTRPFELDDPYLFINRELSMLKFQERVLEEAWDERNPLLERVKFLSILGSNLGEFFMVRVAGLRQQVEAGVTDVSADGMTAKEQLDACRTEAYRLMRGARDAWVHMRPQLAAAGIHLYDWEQLDEAQRAAATTYFTDKVFPVLTPLAFDPGRPFPHISNLSLNLAVRLRTEDGQDLFARVKIPQTLARLVPVPRPAGSSGKLRFDGPAGATREYHFVWLEQLVTANLHELFTGMEIIAAHPFRVTRDAEMAIQELEADDLLETIEQGVRRRRFGRVVRVTVDPSMPDFLREILLENLDLEPEGMITVEPPLGMSGVNLLGLDRPDLKDPPFVGAVPPAFEDEERDIFSLIREGDILLHRPFDSIEPVVEWLELAARDPDVLAIKMTLYRVGRNAPVVAALLEAARNGKEVAVLLELKARFDEESNIEWAKALEDEGVHVVYGLLGLKTHSKIALVVRREGDRIRRYIHVGTGNYNVVTARLYTDLDMLTCADDMGADATELFNFLTGFSRSDDYRTLYVAPTTLRPRFEALIEREIAHAEAGRPARLILKMNSLVDRRMIRLLYRASQAGVRTELLVRGICCLRPGVPGVSDTITVTSIVGRFLEHTRIYYFLNGGDEEIFLGSADLMPRNLDRRVEVLFPVRSKSLKTRLRDEILRTYQHDNLKARHMRSDGTYVHVWPEADETPLDSQAWLIARRPVKRKKKKAKLGALVPGKAKKKGKKA
jgi:polyphosphate kinase